ncbi:hypothetical protein SAMN05216333_12338 [Nitrosomonas oligotropha]|uniref:Uncharacterized protein n=2 Tax=Nitrosomonas oligotropha TaxID=42354 RepID=A0A1H8TBZ7_9PROT|nr:hypothetical protein SAMN05216300_12438 [Nitrosomonas oligotropha]SEO88345.1 hypothetical protein SAMN05216333_12338 [Nitrosomonas oligotropha]
MFGVSVPSDVDEETKALGIPRMNMTGGFSDYLIDKDGNKLASKFISGPFYDIPSAKDHPGLIYRPTDAGIGGNVLFADGTRWRAVGGAINVLLKYNVAPTRSATPVSVAKFVLPYSPIEGSLWQDGDLMEFTSVIERTSTDAGDNTKTIYRDVHIGSNATMANNDPIASTTTAAANDGIPELMLRFRRIDSTTIQHLGIRVNAFDNWGGPSTNNPHSAYGISNFENMDRANMNVDFGLHFSAAPTVDAARLYFVFARLVTCGPGA